VKQFRKKKDMRSKMISECSVDGMVPGTPHKSKLKVIFAEKDIGIFNPCPRRRLDTLGTGIRQEWSGRLIYLDKKKLR